MFLHDGREHSVTAKTVTSIPTKLCWEIKNTYLSWVAHRRWNLLFTIALFKFVDFQPIAVTVWLVVCLFVCNNDVLWLNAKTDRSGLIEVTNWGQLHFVLQMGPGIGDFPIMKVCVQRKFFFRLKLAFHDADTDILARILADASVSSWATCRGCRRGCRCRCRGMRALRYVPVNKPASYGGVTLR